uniref:Uncharacterized protein n=1 Tax=Anopheles maculatus TaxID=74869 RepID=A0A182SST5_9DIPT
MAISLNYLTFGLRSVWFHATNVALHAVATMLFTRVCLTIAGLRRNFAILAGVLFAVHPIHTEAVSTFGPAHWHSLLPFAHRPFPVRLRCPFADGQPQKCTIRTRKCKNEPKTSGATDIRCSQPLVAGKKTPLH